MQAQQLRAGLLEAVRFLEISRSQAAANQLRQFATAFDGLTTQAVKATASRIKGAWNKQSPAYPAELEQLVERLEAVVRTFGGVKFADDLKLILNLFEGQPGSSVETFTREIKAALAPPPPRSRPEKRAKVPKPPSQKSAKLDPMIVIRDYADRLTAASAKQDMFASILAEITEKAGKKGKAGLTAAQINTIADTFLGYALKYRTKDDAIEAMRRRQVQDAIQASKERALSRIGI